MKKSTALLAVLLMLLAGLLTSPTATADASMGIYLDGLFLELGGRPGFRPYYPGYRPYYGYPGYKGYYGYPRSPYNYYDDRFRPNYRRPPYYYNRYYYPSRPPYRSYQGRPPGWRGDPWPQRRYRRY